MPIFIVGAANDPDRLWIADTDDGTIKAIAPDGGAAPSGADIETINRLRRNGYVVIRDVDVAVLVDASDQPPSHQFSE